MALYALVRGFRIRKDKIPYHDIKRLERQISGLYEVCVKMGLKHLEVLWI